MVDSLVDKKVESMVDGLDYRRAHLKVARLAEWMAVSMVEMMADLKVDLWASSMVRYWVDLWAGQMADAMGVSLADCSVDVWAEWSAEYLVLTKAVMRAVWWVDMLDLQLAAVLVALKVLPMVVVLDSLMAV